jgi:hypothetical protein
MILYRSALVATAVVTVVAAVVAAAPAPAQDDRPCPLAALAEPGVEGADQLVVVGQPNPCPPGGAREDWTVTVDFDDGTVAETVFRPGDPLWFLAARHAYRRAGTYDLVGTMTNRNTGESRVVRRTIEIPNAPLTARRTPRPTFLAGQRASRVVARFADGNRLAETGDHTALVQWGDGTRSPGRVEAGPGRSFAVRAAHRYAKPGIRLVKVEVRDDRGGVVHLRGSALVR